MPALRAVATSIDESPTNSARSGATPNCCKQDSMPAGSGFFDRQRVAADDAVKGCVELVRVQHGLGVARLFVGHQRQPHAGSAQRRERGAHLRVELAAAAATAHIVLTKGGLEGRKLRRAAHRLGRGVGGLGQGLDQQFARAVADPVGDLLLAGRGIAKLQQGVVDGVGDLGRGFDQRAVEVEQDQVVGAGVSFRGVHVVRQGVCWGLGWKGWAVRVSSQSFRRCGAAGRVPRRRRARA